MVHDVGRTTRGFAMPIFANAKFYKFTTGKQVLEAIQNVKSLFLQPFDHPDDVDHDHYLKRGKS